MALLGVAGHDFRNLETEVNYLRNLIKTASRKFKDVKFKHSEVSNAFIEMIKNL